MKGKNFPHSFDMGYQLDKHMDFTYCTTKDSIFSPGKIAILKSGLQTKTLISPVLLK